MKRRDNDIATHQPANASLSDDAPVAQKHPLPRTRALQVSRSEAQLRIKLSLIIFAVIVATMLPLGWITVRDLGQEALDIAINQLKVDNAMVRSMIETNQDGLKIALQRLGTAFRQNYRGTFSIDEREHVVVGGVRAHVLKLDGKPISLDDRIVTAFTRETGGSVATVFVRVGDDFLRATSSLTKGDGTPAIGTFLGKDHPAYYRIIAGESYQGQARLFGRHYMTEYIPIRDARNSVIGILFVGMDLTDSINSLLDKARRLKLGETGYVFILNANKGDQHGNFLLHPVLEGKDVTDIEPARKMLEMGSGVLHYDWANPDQGETEPRKKVAVFSEYPELGWIIATSGYVDEFLTVPHKGAYRMTLAIAALALLAILVLNVAVGNWVITPMLRLQRSLARAERTTRTVLDNMQEAVFLHRLDGSLVDVNAKMLEMYRVDKETALGFSFGADFWEFDGGASEAKQLWQRVLDGTSESFEGVARRPLNGTTFPVDAVLCKCIIEGEQRILVNVRDVTKRKGAETRVLKLNRTLRVLSRCNETLVRSVDERQLLDSICRLLVDLGGFRLAWIGFADDAPAGRLRPMALSGHDEGYLSLLSGPERYPDAGCTALQEGRIVQLPRIYAEFAGTPWGDEALERDYQSMIAFPLKDGVTVLGTLNIYAAQPDAFDEEEVALLTELAQDLAFGIVSLRNVSARRAAEEALLLRDRAIASSTEGILISNTTLPGSPIVYANDAVERITGFSPKEILGRGLDHLAGSAALPPQIADLHALINRDSSCQVLVHWQRKKGGDYWGEISIGPVHDGRGKATHVVSIIKDVTERVSYQAQLEHQVKYDALTSLPNRVLLADRIRQAIFAARHKHQGVAVGFVDLDHFKYVNDSLGHSIGDELLKAAASRLEDCLRDGDTVARLGGDEFVFVLPDFLCDEWSIYVLRRIQEEIAKPFLIDGRQLNVTASIGVSLYPQDSGDAETLLRHADIAMYRAKESGRNAIAFFTEEMNRRVQERLDIELELRQALVRDELFLHYQPQFSCADQRIIGAEALVRWRNSRRGLVSPAQFIPVAEEAGLILAIGEWVLRAACRQAADWNRSGTAIKVAVNVSAKQFQCGPDFVRLVEGVLAETGLPSDLLELEITESVLMQNPEAMIDVLDGIKALGVKLALDDFGTGYSSFSYLKRFPIDMLKIDQSFVHDINEDIEAAAIVSAIVSMAHALQLETIAEGVETLAQLEYLRTTGCDQIQGYYLGRPMAAEDIGGRLRESACVK